VAIRALALAVLAACAVLAFRVTDRHYDALDLDRAIALARARQYGPTTKARVDAWVVAERPGARADWTAAVESSARGRAVVTLTLHEADGGVQVWHWRVEVPSRNVEPLDDTTRAFTERIAAWAGDG
jgi:hypothetical protein